MPNLIIMWQYLLLMVGRIFALPVFLLNIEFDRFPYLDNGRPAGFSICPILLCCHSMYKDDHPALTGSDWTPEYA